MNIDHSSIFDRATVALCRDWEKAFFELTLDIESNDIDKDEKLRAIQYFRNVYMYFLTGDRAEKKIQYLSECEKKEEADKRLLENAGERSDVRCGVCSEVMRLDLKELWQGEGKTRVLFMYECPHGHLPRRAFFDDGTEFSAKPTECEMCHVVVKETHERKNDVLISIYKCDECGHEGRDEIDFTSEPDPDLDEQYIRDQKEYCLDEKRLANYREGRRNLDRLSSLFKQHEAEAADTKTNERMSILRRLRVIELQKLLEEKLALINMTKIELSAPIRDRCLKLKITMLDSDSSRQDYDSKKLVSKVIKEALVDTNWRLVSSTLESVLGAVSGELIGYTNDEKIRKVIERENKANKG